MLPHEDRPLGFFKSFKKTAIKSLVKYNVNVKYNVKKNVRFIAIIFPTTPSKLRIAVTSQRLMLE